MCLAADDTIVDEHRPCHDGLVHIWCKFAHLSHQPVQGLEIKKAQSRLKTGPFCFAGWTGLEPAASGVTGRRYNQLNYHPKVVRLFNFVGATGLEPVTLGL